jgi:hypothetical protein
MKLNPYEKHLESYPRGSMFRCCEKNGNIWCAMDPINKTPSVILAAISPSTSRIRHGLWLHPHSVIKPKPPILLPGEVRPGKPA